jgi:hypothetical protein
MSHGRVCPRGSLRQNCIRRVLQCAATARLSVTHASAEPQVVQRPMAATPCCSVCVFVCPSSRTNSSRGCCCQLECLCFARCIGDYLRAGLACVCVHAFLRVCRHAELYLLLVCGCVNTL